MKLVMMTHSYLNRLSSSVLCKHHRICGLKRKYGSLHLLLRTFPAICIEPLWFPLHIKVVVSYLQMFNPSSTYGSGHGMAVWAGRGLDSNGRHPSVWTLDLNGNDAREAFCLLLSLSGKEVGFSLAVWWTRATQIKAYISTSSSELFHIFPTNTLLITVKPCLLCLDTRWGQTYEQTP